MSQPTDKKEGAKAPRRTVARGTDKQLISLLMRKNILEQLDAKADQMGVSRAALIHFAVARLLADDPMVSIRNKD
jgi:hypothetical protein